MSDGVKVVANVEIGLLHGLERQLVDGKHERAWVAVETYCGRGVRRQHLLDMPKLLGIVALLDRQV
jgi:hypothetical protein